MKKAIIFLSVLSLCIAFCSCSLIPKPQDTSESPSSTEYNGTTQAETSAETQALTDAVTTEEVNEVTAESLIKKSDDYEASLPSFTLNVRSQNIVTVDGSVDISSSMYSLSENAEGFLFYINTNDAREKCEKYIAYIDGTGYYANNSVSFSQPGASRQELKELCMTEENGTGSVGEIFCSGKVSTTENGLYRITTVLTDLKNPEDIYEAFDLYEISPSLNIADCELIASFNEVGFLNDVSINLKLEVTMYGQVIPVSFSSTMNATLGKQQEPLSFNNENCAQTESLAELVYADNAKSDWDSVYKGKHNFKITTEISGKSDIGDAVYFSTDNIACDYSVDSGILISSNHSTVELNGVTTNTDTYFKDGVLFIDQDGTRQAVDIEAAMMISQYSAVLSAGYISVTQLKSFTSEVKDNITYCRGEFSDYFAGEKLTGAVYSAYGIDLSTTTRTFTYDYTPFCEYMLDSDGNIVGLSFSVSGWVNTDIESYYVTQTYTVEVVTTGIASIIVIEDII